MLETIVATCRAIAAESRLLILHGLSQEEELAGCEIARRIRLPPSQASRHMARLTGVGLVRLRRSGRRVYYRLAEGGDSAVGPTLAGLVRRACRNLAWATRGWDEEGIRHLRGDTVARLPRDVARLLDVMFDAATAFANVRRLAILALLLRAGPCEASRIGPVLSMSPLACGRQLDKLCRRGYAMEQSPGLWCVSTRPRTPFHYALFALVAARLRS